MSRLLTAISSACTPFIVGVVYTVIASVFEMLRPFIQAIFPIDIVEANERVRNPVKSKTLTQIDRPHPQFSNLIDRQQLNPLFRARYSPSAHGIPSEGFQGFQPESLLCLAR